MFRLRNQQQSIVSLPLTIFSPCFSSSLVSLQIWHFWHLHTTFYASTQIASIGHRPFKLRGDTNPASEVTSHLVVPVRQKKAPTERINSDRKCQVPSLSESASVSKTTCSTDLRSFRHRKTSTSGFFKIVFCKIPWVPENLYSASWNWVRLLIRKDQNRCNGQSFMIIFSFAALRVNTPKCDLIRINWA